MPSQSPQGVFKEGLMAVIDLYNDGTWKPNIGNNQDIVSEGSESAEEFDLGTEESEWEDVED